MNLKLLALVAVGAVSSSCGGGGISSGIPQADACNQASKAFCTKVLGCSDSSTSTLLVKAFLVDEASCETMVLQSCGSTGFQCKADATYHGDQAQMCKDQFSGQDCAMLTASLLMGVQQNGSTMTAIAGITAAIPACGMICTGGADGGGPG